VYRKKKKKNHRFETHPEANPKTLHLLALVVKAIEEIHSREFKGKTLRWD